MRMWTHVVVEESTSHDWQPSLHLPGAVLQILHNGQIAEMRTGEGKTLVAVLPAVLNALTGEGVQVRPAQLKFCS